MGAITVADGGREQEGQPIPSREDELPLPDPYPEYLTCPACGEPEVEVWCYENGARCHACGAWVAHLRGDCNAPGGDDRPRG